MRISHRDIAYAMRHTGDIREDSYDSATGRYRLTCEEAAERAGVPWSIRKLICAALWSGCGEFDDWVSETLGKDGQ